MIDTMMTCAECDDLLLDYFEDQLGEGKRAATEAHIASCARCHSIVRDIGGIRATAAKLDDLAPSRDLWSGIEARIQPSVTSIAAPRPSRGMPRVWMSAAAAALIVVSSSVTYVATSRSIEKEKARSSSQAVPAPASPVRVAGATVEPDVPPGSTAPAPAPPTTRGAAKPQSAPPRIVPRQRDAALASATTSAPRSSSELVLSDEIQRLQQLVESRRDAMEPSTVRIVEENLAIIDAAVKQARAAVAADPGSGFLSKKLENALQKKVQLLRTVAFISSST